MLNTLPHNNEIERYIINDKSISTVGSARVNTRASLTLTNSSSMADQQSSPEGSSTTPPRSGSDGGGISPSKKSINNGPILQSCIKQFVSITNSTLASFEQAADESSHMLVSRLQQIAKQGKFIATRAVSTYEHRGYYGPQIVAGSAAAVGSIVGLRRGKVTGVLAGGITGIAAYGNIYGYDDYSATSWRNSIPKKEE